jgi:hypothetical protein
MSYYTDQRIVNLSSESGTQYKNGSFLSYVNFIFNDFIKPEEDIINISCAVQSASIPLSFYIINEYNSQFEYSFDGINKTIVNFDFGNYNANSFISQFQSKTPFTVIFDKATGRFSFSYTNDFYFHYENSTSFNVLGFKRDITYQSIGNVLQAPFLCDFSGIRNIKIRSSKIGNSNLDSVSGGSFNDLAVIPVNVGYYGIIVFVNQNNFKSIISNKYITEFDIQLVDGFNDELIDFNNVGWTITLQFDILRKLEEKTDLIGNKINDLTNLLTNLFVGGSSTPQPNPPEEEEEPEDEGVSSEEPILETEPVASGDETIDFLLYKNKRFD